MTFTLVDAKDRAVAESDLARNIIVEAGAGTGKTTSLVNRVANLVLSGVPITELAVITFTEAAAEELRTRIQQHLATLINSNIIQAADRSLLETAELDLPVATITTIHGFAAQIVRTYGHHVGVSAQFKQLAGTEASARRSVNWRRYLRSWLDDQNSIPVVRRLIEGNVRFGNLAQAAETATQGWHRLVVGPLPTAAELRAQARACRSQSTERPFVAPDFAKANSILTEIDGLTHHCITPADKLITRIESLHERLDTYQTTWLTDPASFVAVGIDPPKLEGSKGQAKNWPQDVIDQLRDLIKDCTDEIDLQYQRVTSDLAERLRDLVVGFTLHDLSERLDAGELEFHDCLVLSEKIVATSKAAHAELRRTFRCVMVDEFQDTDPLQLRLVLRLGSVDNANGSDIGATDAGRLFFVGDPKQSIYAFRDADVQGFRTIAAAAPHNASRLRTNFRSSSHLLQRINQITESLFITAPSDKQAEFIALEPGLEPTGSATPPVVLLGGQCVGASADTTRRQEADHIAEWIAEQIAQGRRPRDIAVLSPARINFNVVQNALRRRGVPVSTGDSQSVWKAEETQEILSLLRAFAAPANGIAVVGALRTASFAASDTQLLEHRNAKGRWDLFVPAPELSPIKDKFELLLETYWQVRHLPPYEAVRLLITKFQMRERSLILHTSVQMERSIQAVESVALNFEGQQSDGPSPTIRDFLRWTADSRLAAELDEPIFDPNLDAVQLMTIHRSKGLEFPVVVLSGVGTEFRFIERARWLGDSSLEVYASKAIKTARYDMAKAINKDVEADENVRKLYVALTRAESQLAISVYEKVSKAYEPKLPPERGKTETGPTMVQRLAAGLATFDLDAPQLDVRPFDQITGVDLQNEQMVDDAFVDLVEAERLGALADLTSLPMMLAATTLRTGTVDSQLHQELALLERDELVAQGTSRTAYGRAVHRALQYATPTDPSTYELAAQRAARYEGVDAASDIKATIEHVFKHTPIARAFANGTAKREYPVAFKWHGLVVDGIVDLMVSDLLGLTIYDYKTDRFDSQRDQDEAINTYRRQLAVYAKACAEIFPETPVVDCVLLFCGHKGVTPVSLGSQQDLVRQLDGEIALRANDRTATVKAAVSRLGGRGTT